jgi:excisionase family DNA binding protein
MNNLLSTGQLAKFLGVSLSTIYRWLKRHKIEEPQRTYGNHRRFEKQKFIQRNTKTIVYSRVSSYGQKDDLIRQTKSLQDYATSNNYKNIEIISDIGSGLNYDKRGFKQLMKLIVNQEIDTIIIQHKDRLNRFGLGIITAFSNEFGTTIKVVENEENKSKDILLMNDLMVLLTSFTGSIHGRRSHQNKKIVQNG